MPKRGGGTITKERPMRRRHLYLVLDDWSRGYTIRKIDLLPDPAVSYPSRKIVAGGFSGKQRLPAPILRVDAARGLPKHLVASGRHLMFMQPSDRWKEEPTFKFVPTIDMATRSTVFCRLPIDFPDRLPIDFPDNPIYLPAGGSIYILDRNCFFQLTPASTFDHLSSSPVPADLKKLNMLLNPPFQRKQVISYSYHEHALFFASTLNDDAFISKFDIIEGRWYQVKVRMPYVGDMHFDPVLDAFVGFSVFEPEIGHIYLTYMDGSWKLSKEKLFSRSKPPEKQVGRTLVNMGGRSNFCLVECISHDQTKCKDVSVHSCSLFRLTPFFLKYDSNGDLRIVKLQVQYYNVPQGVTESALNNPAAFWM